MRLWVTLYRARCRYVEIGKTHSRPMTVGRRIARRVSATLLVATYALMPVAPARADPGCSLGDIVNGLVSTVGSLTSGECAAACADGVGCGVAAGIAAGLGAVAAGTNQNSVNTFCTDLNNAVGDISTIQNALSSAGISQDLTDAILNALNGIGDPLSVAQCGCSLEQGANQVGSNLGSCFAEFEQGLCQAMNFGQSCTCTPPAPVLADCAQSNTNCDSNNTDPACVGGGPGGGSIVAGYDPNTQTIQNISPYPPAQQVSNSAGTAVSIANTGCGGISYCFCPKPMVPTWTLDIPENNLNPNNCIACANHFPWYIFSCNCPSGTHPDPSGKTVGGVPVCICDGTTNEVANLSSEALFGMCPPPNCPTGQVRLSGVGKCVTPCSDPTKGMTEDGACCDPSQMSSCGTCCPPGTVPDPATGACLLKQVAQ